MRLILKTMGSAFDKTYLFWGFVGGVVLGCLELVF